MLVLTPSNFIESSIEGTAPGFSCATHACPRAVRNPPPAGPMWHVAHGSPNWVAYSGMACDGTAIANAASAVMTTQANIQAISDFAQSVRIAVRRFDI
jgi:hypothetical protein